MNILEICGREKGLGLEIDKACLNLVNKDEKYTLEVWGQSEECFSCSPWKYLSLKPGDNATLKVNSTYPTHFYIRLPYRIDDLYSSRFHFTQHGSYLLQFNSSTSSPVITSHQGDNEYIAILIAFLILIFLYSIWMCIKCVQTRLDEEEHLRTQVNNESSDLLNEERPSSVENEPVETEHSQPSTSTRLRSLDTFRGITITVMIFVNYGGGKFYFFKHSPWNGLTVADLVFPWFLWIMGVSLTLSLHSQLQKKIPSKFIFLKIMKRSLCLFVLGLVTNSLRSNFLPELRIFGVLQRFAFCYLLTAVLEALCMKICKPGEDSRGWWPKDIGLGWIQWLVIISLIILHTAILFALPVPGCPMGYLGPGGVHAKGKHANCTGGATGYIDRLILGVNHMYKHPTCKTIYDSYIPFDPEGILGILMSCLTVQFGVATGRIILSFPHHSQRLKRWLLWGTILGIGSGFLCNWKKENGLIPVNKNLWSLSYVCVTASFAFFLLACLYYWVDFRKKWSGSIFRLVGMNSILLYLGHELTHSLFPWSWTPLQLRHADHLAMNLWGMSLWLIIGYWCHKRKLYFSL